jgi:hypothetical protein
MAKIKATPGRGGIRPGSGAKKKKETREPITLYILKSIMKKNGGKDRLRKHLYTYLGQRVHETDGN